MGNAQLNWIAWFIWNIAAEEFIRRLTAFDTEPLQGAAKGRMAAESASGA